MKNRIFSNLNMSSVALNMSSYSISGISLQSGVTHQQSRSPGMKSRKTVALCFLVSMIGSGYSENIDIIHGDKVTLKCR